MNNPDYVSILGTLLQVNAGFLGVAVTLVSLIPALLGAVNQGGAAFVQNAIGKKLMENGLRLLRVTIFLFSSGCLIGMLAFFHREEYMLHLCAGASILGLSLIAVAAFKLARISLFTVSGGSV